MEVTYLVAKFPSPMWLLSFTTTDAVESCGAGKAMATATKTANTMNDFILKLVGICVDGLSETTECSMLFQAELITICQPLGRFIVKTHQWVFLICIEAKSIAWHSNLHAHTHTHIIHKHKRKPAQCKPAHFKQFTVNYLAYYSYRSLLMLSSHFDSVFAAIFDTFSTLTIM